MPTDPFVPPDPDARPRQQQNLPPGIGLPAPRRWQPNRPGDLRAAQPTGPMLGNPGPNVGYAYTLAERLRERFVLDGHEHLDDVIAVVAEIAGKRAATFGRAPIAHDIDFAAALLGYDGSGDPRFVDARVRLVHEAGHDYSRRRALVDAVSDALLRASTDEAKRRAPDWRAQLASQLSPELERRPIV